MDLGQTIVLILMGLITAANYLRYRDVLYPPVIQAGLWTAVVLLYFLNQDKLLPLSLLLYAILIGGLVLFSTGSYLATRGHHVHKARLPQIPFHPKPGYATALMWLPVVGLVPFLLVAYGLGQDGPLDSFYRNLRYAIISPEDAAGGGAFGIWAYLLPISYTSILVQTLLATYREHPVRYGLCLATAVLYALALAAKGTLLFLFVILAGVLLITRRASPLKTALVGAGASVCVFVAVSLALHTATNGSSYGDSVQGVFDLFVSYALGSLPAFDAELAAFQNPEGGANSFRTVYAVLSALGADVEVKPVHLDYTFVPFPTNVYTVYRPYFVDFSFWGLLLAPLALGWGHGYLYRKATRGTPIFFALYALALYPLIMQFYQDHYLTLLSQWTQYVVLLVLYFYRFRILPKEEAPGRLANEAVLL